MENKKIFTNYGPPFYSSTVSKPCRTNSPQGANIKFPTFSSLTEKNFRNAVDFKSQEKWPCKNSWYTDVRALHIRNRHLLDSPFLKPPCCAEIHNAVVDRRKMKKLKKYGLTRPARKRTSNLEPETCIPMDTEEKPEMAVFLESYTLDECSCEDELGDNDDDFSENEKRWCLGGSSSEEKKDKEERKDWKELLHTSDIQVCQEIVAGEIKKHKLGQDMKLNLRKFN